MVGSRELAYHGAISCDIGSELRDFYRRSVLVADYLYLDTYRGFSCLTQAVTMPRRGFMVSSWKRCLRKNFKPTISPMRKLLVVSVTKAFSSSSSVPSLAFSSAHTSIDWARRLFKGFLPLELRVAWLPDGRERLWAPGVGRLAEVVRNRSKCGPYH